ncbi:MAG: hypothetical protein JRH07_10600 [Deltaproteobacteria bacterium]|nr:hypothetical protein [Deltaproteobacteria bacterium]
MFVITKYREEEDEKAKSISIERYFNVVAKLNERDREDLLRMGKEEVEGAEPFEVLDGRGVVIYEGLWKQHDCQGSLDWCDELELVDHFTPLVEDCRVKVGGVTV